MKPRLRLVFMGSAEFACPALERLIRIPEWRPAAVVTQPDRPRGRGLALLPTPVKSLATARGVPVLQPEKCRDSRFLEELERVKPDLIVAAAYGQILPAALLAIPRCGCLNIHASLLPRHRGAAPIQRAILEGDRVTGVTIMQVDEGLDTGAILSQAETPISPEDDARSLHDRLAAMGAELLAQTIEPYVTGKLKPRPQPEEGASYAPKIKREEGRMDWSEPAERAWRRVRAMTPWPGAHTFLPFPERPLLKIWKAEPLPLTADAGLPGEVLAAGSEGIDVACGEGALRLLEVQREGSRRMRAREFLAGSPLPPGTRLGAGA
ncbi:MAG: methionyl-tRNA formyltransferase [Verrucomicrobia bacterium]|nr:methionyl-tRNA formyltransferase [Verrucomicrobiota bacterium]